MKYKQFIRQNYFLLNLILIVAFFFGITFATVQGIGSYPGYSITEDEVPHTGSGIYYLYTGKYFLNPEHPPLIKDLSAIPTRLMNFNLPEISKDQEGGNDQWDFGRRYIFEVGNDPAQIALYSRTMILALNCILLAGLAFALRKATNPKAALVSVAALAMTPLLIAHGSLITTDVTSSFLQALTLISVYLMLKKPTRKSIILTGLITGVTLLSKFNTVMLVPAIFIASYIIWRRCHDYPGKTLIKIIISWLVIAGLVVLVVYIPHVWNMDAETMRAFIASQTDPKFGPFFDVLNNLAQGNVVIRAIYWYLVGVSMALSRIANAYQNTYFMGTVYGQSGAGPLYFPILLILKTPLSLIGFIWFASYLYFDRIIRTRVKAISHLNTLLFAYMAAYAAVSLATSLQLGLRHFMPVYVILVIISAQILVSNWNLIIARIKVRTITLGLMVITLVLTLLAFPYYLSYYNTLAGGTANGYIVATDSNFDWAQDLKQLGIWIKANDVKFAYEDIFTSSSLTYYMGIPYQELKTLNKLEATSGTWIFISAHELQDNLYSSKYSEDQKYTWLLPYFYDRVGTSIFVFKIP